MYSVEDIRAKKKELKLTTADIANSTELPVSTVSKIMTGETKNPSYITIERINKFIEKKERNSRVEAYLKLLRKYMEEHSDEVVDQYKFFCDYSEEYPFHKEHPTMGATLDDIRNIESRYVELINGFIKYKDVPKMNHHIIVQRLGRTIDKYIDDNHGTSIMYSSGIGVRFKFDESNYFISDIVVICDKDIMDSEGILGAPDWVIEVTAPDTRTVDYKDKMHKYMCEGVREYWIIDTDKERVVVHINGEPMMTYIYSFSDEIPVNIYDGKLKISIDD